MTSRRKIFMKIEFTLFTVLLAIMMTACGRKYAVNEDDVIRFVKEEYGLENVKVMPNPYETKNVSSDHQMIWEVEVDDEWDTTFQVKVDISNVPESNKTTIDYYGNYYDMLLNNVAGDYDLKNLSIEEQESEGGYKYIRLVGSFDNYAELVALYDEAYNFRQALLEDDYKMEFQVMFRLNQPYRNTLNHQPDSFEGEVHTVSDGDYIGRFTTIDSSIDYDAELKEAATTLVGVAIDYQLYDILYGLSDDEIQELFRDVSYKIGILRGDDTNIEYYDMLCGSINGYGISFCNLYIVLKTEGFSVEGDARHYSFVGADGKTYEISEDFLDTIEYQINNYETASYYGYYYIVDGEKTPMEVYFYNHFDLNEVRRMTGLEIVW